MGYLCRFCLRSFDDSQDQYFHERSCGVAKNKVAKVVATNFGENKIAKISKRKIVSELADS